MDRKAIDTVFKPRSKHKGCCNIKNHIKIMIGFILTVVFFTMAITPVSALEVKKEKNDTVPNEDVKISISDRMTFQEITEAIAKESCISKSQAEKKIQFAYEQNHKGFSSNSKEQISAATYRVLSIPLSVLPGYQPRLRLYCHTSEGNYHYGILEIIEGNLCCEYDSKVNGKAVKISKVFSGSLYANLEDPNTIFYNVNGDFYDNGVTSVNRAEIGQGQTTVNYNIPSQVGTHYAYCFLDGHAIF